MMILKLILVVVAIVYVALVVIGYFFADRMIFLPPAASYTTKDLPVRFVEADDGARIATLHLVNPSARYTLLYSHGNAEDLGQLAPILDALQAAGFSVLAYDYRGYGASGGGPPSARGAYRDVVAVYRAATERFGIAPSRIVAYGRSVGSGPATHLAGRHEVAGLVIESGFTSAFRVVTRIGVLPFDRFPNLRDVRHVDAPVLVIHGTRDEVIPFSHGLALHAAARSPKQSLWVEGAHHNDLAAVAGARLPAALREFAELLDRAGGGDEPVAAPP